MKWAEELAAAGGEKYVFQDRIKARFGAKLPACLAEVKVLDEDPRAYAAMLAEPILVGNTLQGSLLLDAKIHAQHVRAAMLGQGFRLRGGGGVDGGVDSAGAGGGGGGVALRGARPRAAGRGGPPTCGAVLNAATRLKDVLRAAELAGRLRAALGAEANAHRGGGGGAPLSSCKGGLAGVRTMLVVERALWTELETNTVQLRAVRAAFDVVERYDEWQWRADDAALELELGDAGAPPVPGAPRAMPTLTQPKRAKFFKTPRLWLLRISATLRAPFDRTLLVDNDAFPCAGIGAQFERLAAHDVAAVVDGFGGSRGDRVRPYPPQIFARESDAEHSAAWRAFEERNLGFVLVATGRPIVRRFLRRYLRTYVRLVNDLGQRITHDQTAFRQALFALSADGAAVAGAAPGGQQRALVRHEAIPKTVGCRPYEQAERERLAREQCAASACAVMHCHDCGQWAHPAPQSARLGGWRY